MRISIIITTIFLCLLLSGCMGSGGSSITPTLNNNGNDKEMNKVVQDAIEHINTIIFSGTHKVELISAKEESGVYNFKIDISGSKYTSFVTKDGKYLFADGINLLAAKVTKTIILKSAFVVEPNIIRIKKGNSVEFVNQSSFNHTILIDNNAEEFRKISTLTELRSSKSSIHIFKESGEYTFYSKEYPPLRGTIYVE